MYSTFSVSKSTCMLCNNQVMKTLGTIQGIFGAEIDQLKGQIVVSHTDEVTREQISEALFSMGFSECEPENKQRQEIETDEPSIWGCVL